MISCLVNHGDRQEQHDAVAKLTSCQSCGGPVDIQARDDAPYLVCSNCGEAERVAIFDIDEVSYVSRPNFTDIWLPPD